MAEFSENLAVVIGIDQYEGGISSLKTAVNDVKAIAQHLQQDHHYRVKLLVNQQATLSALTQLLTTDLPQWVRSDSRLLFYFAGHGIALNGDEGPQGYLIPQDARVGNTLSYLAMPALQAALSKLTCRHFLGILDCCFAGAFRWSSTRDIGHVPKVMYQERYDRFVRDPAWQILTSSAHDQRALDAFSLAGDRTQIEADHSPFAAALLEALSGKADAYPPAAGNKLAGDGVITATELYLYLRDRVEVATEQRAARQTPGIHTLKQHDKGEYIFLSPGHPLNLPPAPPLDESQNPYRGLQPFEAQHSDLFFGRCELTQKLQTFVSTRPLTVVLGASGSGKSSLVRAGLIPQLKTENDWHVLLPIRPGETPFQSINEALSQARLPTVNLSCPNQTLTASIAVWVERHPSKRLLLFIDQIEEIVTLCGDEKIRKCFFEQILGVIAAHRNRFHLIVTLRSDLEPQVRDAGLSATSYLFEKASTALFKRHWQRERFIVPAMTRRELRAAIEAPAEARVMHFQPHTLVERIVDEVADMPGALPLLSFALSELYLKYLRRQRSALYNGKVIDRAMTQSDYESLGGVIQSLTQRADEEYQCLLNKHSSYERVVQQLMLRMVAIDSGELARRRVPVSELVYSSRKNELMQAAIAQFIQARLLVKGQDAMGNAYIEPAHDALVRGWQQLQGWINKEKTLSLQRRLTVAATEWKAQRHQKYLWTNNPYLDVLEKDVLNTADNNWLNEIETRFVQQSLARRRRESVTRWSLVNGVLILLSSAVWMTTRYAISSQNDLLSATSSSAVSQFTAGNELDALEQAVRAGVEMSKMVPAFVEVEAKSDVVHALQSVFYGIRERNRFGAAQKHTSVGFSLENRIIATGLEEGEIGLWSIEGKLLEILTHDSKEAENHVMEVEFIQSGETLISASRQGINIWRRQPEGTFSFDRRINPEGDIMSVAVSDKAQMIASTSMDTDIITLWDLEGNVVKQFDQFRHLDRINALDFSPDGETLVTGSADGTIKVWDLPETQPVNSIEVGKNIFSLTFVNEDTVAIGTTEGNVELWKIEGNNEGTAKEELREQHDAAVHELALSEDGTRLVSVGGDTMMIWQVADKELIETVDGYGELIRDVVFTNQSDQLISASEDRSLRLWQLGRRAHQIEGMGTRFSSDNQEIAIAKDDTIYLHQLSGVDEQQLLSHEHPITRIDLASEDNLVASADSSGKIKLFSRRSNTLIEWDAHLESITSLRFSPNEQMLLSASIDETVKLWDLKGNSIATFNIGSVVSSAEFDPKGQSVAVASKDGILRILRVSDQLRHLEKQKMKEKRIEKEAQQEIAEKYLTERDLTEKEPIETDILDVSFSPNGRTIASAGEDGFIYLWSIDQPKFATRFRVDADIVHAVKFMPDGRSLVVAKEEGTVEQWTLDGNFLQALYVHAGAEEIAFSVDGTMISSASYSNTTVARAIAPKSLVEQSCKWLQDFHLTTDSLSALCSTH